ncbi:MAG: pyridoxamine 5'-phosphate oxidase family protein [Dehalococcoidia bacterium]
MATWGEFAIAAPELAAFGHERFREIPVSMLATVREDGWPRLHPFEPIIAEGHLFVFTYRHPPKVHDLRNDGRCVVHNTVIDNDGGAGEFTLRARAAAVEDEAVAAVAWKAVESKGWKPDGPLICFELLVESAFAITYADGEPSLERWPGEV